MVAASAVVVVAVELDREILCEGEQSRPLNLTSSAGSGCRSPDWLPCIGET